MITDLCKCGNPSREGQRTCLECHAAYMREYRSKNSLTSIQRMKDNARSYAGVYLRRGKLERMPCQINGCENKSEMHHENYDKPLDVEWFCRGHHLELHRNDEA